MIAPQKLFQHDHATFAVLKYFVIPEPDNAKSFGFDDRSPICIAFLRMLATVDLDHDLLFMAGEVGKVVPQWRLESEPSIRKHFL